MDINNMKNMVIIKNLPSNIIEEAFVVLKDNVKLCKEEVLIKNKDKNNIIKDNKIENENYVLKEAEMLLEEYASKIENRGNKTIIDKIKLEEKCKKFKLATIFLGIFSILSSIALIAR